MNHPEKKEIEDLTKKFNIDTCFTRIKNNPFNFLGKIDAISSCDSDVFDEKEDIHEISNFLGNLSKHENFESDEDTAISRVEISCILRKKNSNFSLNNFRRTACRKISLVGRVLHSDNNVLSRMINPVRINKKIPVRVSNPVYKNFDRDN